MTDFFQRVFFDWKRLERVSVNKAPILYVIMCMYCVCAQVFLEAFAIMPWHVWIRFGKWDAILAEPIPGAVI